MGEFTPFRGASTLELELVPRTWVQVQVDLVAFVREHLEEYWALELAGGYEEYERPMVLLYQLALDEGAAGTFILTPNPYLQVQAVRVEWEDNWRRVDYAMLLAAVPEADPRNRPDAQVSSP